MYRIIMRFFLSNIILVWSIFSCLTCIALEKNYSLILSTQKFSRKKHREIYTHRSSINERDGVRNEASNIDWEKNVLFVYINENKEILQLVELVIAFLIILRRILSRNCISNDHFLYFNIQVALLVGSSFPFLARLLELIPRWNIRLDPFIDYWFFFFTWWGAQKYTKRCPYKNYMVL